MRLTSLIRRLVSACPPARSKRVHSRPARARRFSTRPRVEPLEERAAATGLLGGVLGGVGDILEDVEVIITSGSESTPPSGPSLPGITFGGRATVLQASVLGLLDVRVVDTGPLPSAGGALEDNLATADVFLGLLGSGHANVLHAATMGGDRWAMSSASVANFDLDLLGIGISADIIESWAQVDCWPEFGGAFASGGSTIANLVIGGTTINVTGEPNQRVDLPLSLGFVVINEQSGVSSPTFGSMTVNAVHIVVHGVADVVIASSSASITCPV